MYYPSDIFPNTRGFENWGISLGCYPVFQSRDAFKPIVREQKYLMDYKSSYFSAEFRLKIFLSIFLDYNV